jgi:serine/threonine-protein kinase
VTDFIGRKFGNYTATRLLGEGGFGAVYLAEHPYVSRKAAVKVLHPMMAREAELVSRFFNEARAASAIRHPGIVEVFDAGMTEEQLPYILMELLEGESLKDRVTRLGRLSPDDAVRLVCEAASALHAAHQAGIVHRDLKPENIFVVPGPRGRGEQVKILDFGIAKLNGWTGKDMVRTQVGQFMGSPVYMSPDQWQSGGVIDQRSDVYSLGVILFELLAGRPPFDGQSPFELRDLHLRARAPSLAALGIKVGEEIETAIRRAMAKDPSERFADMAELLAFFGVRPSEVVPAADRPVPRVAGPMPVVTPARTRGRTAPPRTTLSSGTGEMQTAGDQDDGDEEIPRVPLLGGRRRRALLAGVLGVAAVIVGVAVLGPGGSEPGAGPEVPAVQSVFREQQPAQPPERALPPAVVPVPSRRVAAPVRRVALRLRSEPPGAQVVDAATGKVLGRTPLDRSFPLEARPRRVKLSKRGFGSYTLELAGEEDVDQEVVLEKVTIERPEDVIL